MNSDINPFILLFAVGSLFLELLKFLVSSSKTYVESQNKSSKEIIRLENELDKCEDINRVLSQKVSTLQKYIIKQNKDIDEARALAIKYKKKYLREMKR